MSKYSLYVYAFDKLIKKRTQGMGDKDLLKQSIFYLVKIMKNLSQLTMKKRKAIFSYTVF